MRIASIALFVAVFGLGTAAQDVFVASPGGTTPQAAIDLADDGDVVLLETGVYTDGFLVDDKALVIIGEPGTQVLDAVRVTNIRVGSTVTLRGLTIRGNGNTGAPALNVISSTGHIVLEDLALFGAASPSDVGTILPDPATIGLRAFDVSSLTVTRSTITGGDGAPVQLFSLGSTGATGLDVRQTNLAMRDSTVAGGKGGNATGSPQSGGRAVDTWNSDILFGGSEIVGGPSGDTFLGIPKPSVGLVANSADVDMLDTTITADTPLALNNSTVTELTGDARSFVVDSPTREGEESSLDYAGFTGDTIGVFYSFASGYAPLPSAKGIFSVGAPLFGPIIVPVTAPDGLLAIPFIVPELGAGIDSTTLYYQAFVLGSGGKKWLSSPTASVSLDASF